MEELKRRKRDHFWSRLCSVYAGQEFLC